MTIGNTIKPIANLDEVLVFKYIIVAAISPEAHSSTRYPHPEIVPRNLATLE
jgi:hypothetical protein